MTIEFRCTSCDKLLRVKDESAGKKAKCPECSTVLQIPDAGGADEGDPLDFAAAPASGNAPAAAPSDNPFQSPQADSSMPSSGPVGPGEIVATRIDMGDILSTTWAILKTQMGMAIAVFFVAFIINISVTLVIGVVQGLLGEDMVLAAIPLQFAANVFSVFIGIGQMRIFLDIARGHPASFNKLFSGGPYLVNVFLASLAVGLITMVGLVLLIVPGIILALMFSQFYLLCIDRNLGVGDSLSKSREITAGNKGTLFIIGLATFGLAILAILTCGLGMIIFYPYMMLMPAVIYLRMTGQPVANV